MSKAEQAEQGTRSRILEAAEDLLRLHGPEKMTVVDVARHLGMSHSNVYKHFSSKADLRSAVVELWLKRITHSLSAIAEADGPAEQRLRQWMHRLVKIKRAKVLDDPKMFRAYHALAETARGAVDEHVATMLGQIAKIIGDGNASGEWQVKDAKAAAATMLHATTRFHHPHFVMEYLPPLKELDQVLSVLVAGLRGGVL